EVDMYNFAANIQSERLRVVRCADAWRVRRLENAHGLCLSAVRQSRRRVEEIFSGIQPEDAVLAAIVRYGRRHTGQSGIAPHVVTSAQRCDDDVGDRFTIAI